MERKEEKISERNSSKRLLCSVRFNFRCSKNELSDKRLEFQTQNHLCLNLRLIRIAKKKIICFVCFLICFHIQTLSTTFIEQPVIRKKAFNGQIFKPNNTKSV